MGCIADYRGKCVYRFYEAFYDKKGNKLLSNSNVANAPIVAVGLVAYWLHYRSNPNQLASFGRPCTKSIQEIFRDYTAGRLSAYNQEAGQRPSSWRGDLERDFYVQHIIPSEQRLFKQSKALFEYITSEDRQTVKDVMDEYSFYLEDKCKAYQPSIIKSKKEKAEEKVRIVDTAKIGEHFKLGFDKQTHLPTMKLLLEAPASDKKLARVALMMYESRWFLSNDYHTFSKWYKDFCHIVRCSYHKDYAPSALRPISQDLKNKYYFL